MPYLFVWRHRKGLARLTRGIGKGAIRTAAFWAGAAIVLVVAARLNAGGPRKPAVGAAPPRPTDIAPAAAPRREEAAGEPGAVAAEVAGAPQAADDPVDEAGLESFPASDPPANY